ncbi:MAG: YraN family protein [Clostridia bacterium]|nr:YraN family protein [Clostridia bacterium]
MNNVQYGKKGEDCAAKYIKNKGYKIVERNFTVKQGEIDIIATQKDTIVFIEVKTRHKASDILPSQSVGAVKQAKYRKVALLYIKMNKLFNRSCRFDIIEVCGGKINHIENAFN